MGKALIVQIHFASLYLTLSLTVVTCTLKSSHNFFSVPFHPRIFSQVLFFVRNHTLTHMYSLYLDGQYSSFGSPWSPNSI